MTKKKQILLLGFLLIGLTGSTLAATRPLDPDDLKERLHRLSPLEMDEVLWLARCIYSETNQAHEQKLVAWVVRNRVDTDYRGSSYREVVLEPLQFSAFNQPSERRTYILGLNQNTPNLAWRQALGIALDVYEADPRDRPFAQETRHFFSPVSMAGGLRPPWAQGPASLDSERLGVDPDRFRFYDRIDESADPFLARETPLDHIETFQEKTRERLAPPTTDRPSLRERWKPSGRVARPARPRATSIDRTKRPGW